jgi:hypothetical protein
MPKGDQDGMRQRNVPKDDSISESEVLLSMHRFDPSHRGSETPCAEELQQNSKAGYLRKRHFRCLNMCPCLCGPVWKTRYFILKGSYLFRFASNTASKPKGAPIPITSITTSKVEGEDRCFLIQTIRKEIFVQAENVAERDAWIAAIQRRKHMAIKESMGHAKISNDDAKANKAGDFLFNRKLKYDKRESDGVQMMAHQAGVY